MNNSCHTDLIDPSSKVVHSPTKQKQCTLCHNPHGSKTAHQLYSDNAQLCISCHKEFKAENLQDNPKGQCLVCHKEHHSIYPGLLRKKARSLCLSCHSKNEDQLKNAHLLTSVDSINLDNINLDSLNCIKCHDPHSSSKEESFLKYRHQPFMDKKCASCHE